MNVPRKVARLKLDEHFADVADRVTETMGKWQIFLLSVLAVVVWFLCGPFAHFSDTWQLAINTPTTILEMWLELLILAAANRVERRNAHLLACLFELVQKVDAVVERREQEQAELLPDAER